MPSLLGIMVVVCIWTAFGTTSELRKWRSGFKIFRGQAPLSRSLVEMHFFNRRFLNLGIAKMDSRILLATYFFCRTELTRQTGPGGREGCDEKNITDIKLDLSGQIQSIQNKDNFEACWNWIRKFFFCPTTHFFLLENSGYPPHTVPWLNSSVTLLVSKAPLNFLCVFEWIGHSVLECKCFFVFRGA